MGCCTSTGGEALTGEVRDERRRCGDVVTSWGEIDAASEGAGMGDTEPLSESRESWSSASSRATICFVRDLVTFCFLAIEKFPNKILEDGMSLKLLI